MRMNGCEKDRQTVRGVRREAREYLFLIHLLRGLTRVTCTTVSPVLSLYFVLHSQQYHSNVTDILNSRFALEYRYVRWTFWYRVSVDYRRCTKRGTSRQARGTFVSKVRSRGFQVVQRLASLRYCSSYRIRSRFRASCPVHLV